MIEIRRFKEEDWPAVWRLMKPVIRTGETYPYAVNMSCDDAHRMWVDVTDAAYVAEDESDTIVGTYYIKPNQPTLGAHVANCGYMVSESARGRGVGSRMCEHSQSEAVALGFRAMQFNLVVETNSASVHLWKKLGFDVVGLLPGAFSHPTHGDIGAYVMYKSLVER